MQKNTFKNLRYSLYIVIIMWFIIFYYLLVNPILYYVSKSHDWIQASENNLKNHVQYLTSTKKERNYKETETLNKVWEYIFNHFKKAWCDKVNYQEFKASWNTYKNVICDFNWKTEKIIVVWAHYDVDSDNTFLAENETVKDYFAWADDNASWVAWIMELATIIWKNKNNINKSIQIVAYNLEEMPFFDSEQMWSYIHAKSHYDKKTDIDYMISLEMIWYFSDNKIQTYPINFLNWFYPSKWNFIAIVWKLFDFNIQYLKVKMIKNSDILVKSLSAPSFINWASFSDHRNYWHFWYKAYMVTDTAFFRNPNYHKTTDTINTLDFNKMKEVVNWVYWIIMK